MIKVKLQEFKKNLDSITDIINDASVDKIYIYSELETLFIKFSRVNTFIKIKTNIDEKEKDIAVTMERQQFLSFINKLKKVKREFQLEVINEELVCKIIKPLKKANKQGMLYDIENEIKESIVQFRKQNKQVQSDVESNMIDFDSFLDFCKISTNMKENDESQNFKDSIGLFIDEPQRKATFTAADNIFVLSCNFGLKTNTLTLDKPIVIDKTYIDIFLKLTSKATDLDICFQLVKNNLILKSETFELIFPIKIEKFPNVYSFIESTINQENKEILCSGDSLTDIKDKMKEDVAYANAYKLVVDIPSKTKEINNLTHKYTPTIKSFGPKNYLLIWDKSKKMFDYIMKREVFTFEKEFINMNAYDYRYIHYIVGRLVDCKLSISNDILLISSASVNCMLLPARINFN